LSSSSVILYQQLQKPEVEKQKVKKPDSKSCTWKVRERF